MRLYADIIRFFTEVLHKISIIQTSSDCSLLPKRNEEMVIMADAVLVIWDGKSRGAGYTIKYAKRMGKMVKVITVAEEV